MKPKFALRHFLALAGSSLLAISSSHAVTYIWNDSNVTNTTPVTLDWFSGGSNTQATWNTTPGAQGSSLLTNADTIQFFTNSTTSLTNTLASILNSNVNNGGTAVQLGTLTLSGRASNTNTITTTVNIGGDALNFSAATGTINLDAANQNNNRNLVYNVNSNIQLGKADPSGNATALTLTGNGTSAFTIAGNITENFAGSSLIKSGTSTVILSGTNNTYSGTTTLSAGTLQGLVTGTSLNPVSPFGAGTILLNGGTLDLRASGTLNTTAETINFGNNVTVGGNATIYAIRQGGSSSNKTIGLGTLSIGSNTLSIDGANVGYFLAFSAVTLTGDATISFLDSFMPLTLGAITQSGSNRSLTTQGAGTLRLTGTNDYTGSTTISGGTLEVQGSIASSSSIINNSVLKFNSSSAQSYGNVISGSGSLSKSGVGTATLSGDNTFTGSVTVGDSTGNGTLVFSGINSYTGATNIGGSSIGGGTLSVNSVSDYGVPSAIGAALSGAINLTGNLDGTGTFIYTGSGGSGGSMNRQFSIGDATATARHGAIYNNGSGALILTATTFNVPTGGGATRRLTLGGTYTGSANEIRGVIADNFATTSPIVLTKAGVSIWKLSGANTFTGGTTISGGGGLILDYTTQDNRKLGTGGLTFTGAGTITLKGGLASTIENNGSTNTALNAGGTFIARDGGTAPKIRLNAITRAAGGTISFADATIADTDTNNINSILGGYATLGNDWAVSVNAGAADTAVTALASYTPWVNTTGSATDNYLLNGSGSIVTTGVAANSVKITNSANSETLALNALNLTITSASATSLGGIMYAGGSDNLYSITGTGRIVSSTANQELIFAVQTGTLSVSAFVGLSGAASAVTKSGAGTMEISSNNNFTGAVRVNQGVLRLANANATGSTGGGITVQNGAALELTGGLTFVGDVLTITGSGISSGGALRNVSGANTYQGGIIIGNGGARINNADTGNALTVRGITTAALADVTFGGAGNITHNTTAISGAGGLIKDGTGTLTLSVANTFTGTTQVNQGTLSLTGSLSSSSALAVGGGTFSFGGSAAQTINGLTVNAGSSVVTNTNSGTTNKLNLGAITRNAGGGSVNFSNASAANNVITTSNANTNGILGAWASVGGDWATKDGSGNIVAYTAYTDVNRLGGAIADGATTNVRIVEAGSSGNITLSGTTAINTLLQSASGGPVTVDVGTGNTLRTSGIMVASAAGALTVSSGTITAATAGGELMVTNNSTNGLTISSDIADHTSASSFTKLGTGSVTITSAVTYTGATHVNQGTLFVNNTTGSGTGAGTVNVAVGGTLGGSGTIAGATTVNGNLAPGNSPGVLSFDSSLALGANSTTTLEIDGTTRGTLYDGVNVGTTLLFDGSLVFDFGTPSAFDGSADLDLFSFITTSTGDFDSVTSTGFYTGTWDKTGDIWSLTDEGQTLNFSEVTGNLTLAVIPEPGAALLGSLGLLMLLRRRR